MKGFFGAILRVAVGLVAIVLFGTVVMLLWNWLLPPIAGLPAITILQAVGLLALSRILFGGLGGTGRVAMGGVARGRHRDHSNPFREKWGKMSTEERREFFHKHHPFFHAHFFDDHGGDEPDQETPAGGGFPPDKDRG